MNALDTYPTYEAFEAEMVRELGLSMSIERMREIGSMSCRRQSPVRAQNSLPTLVPVAPASFESRYRACSTATERRAFVRANKAAALAYLRSSDNAPVAIPARLAPAGKSRCVRRSYK